MQRKLPNGRYTPEYKTHVVAWVAAKAGRTAVQAAREFDVDAKSMARWMRASEVVARVVPDTSSRETADGGAASSSRAKPKGQPGGRYRAPVEDLGREDKERAVRSVRNIAEIVDLGTTAMLRRLRKAIALEGVGPSDEDREKDLALLLRVSKDDSQAFLHLSRTQSLLVDTFPGVLKLAGVKEQTETGKRNLAAVAAALGLVKD